MIAPAVRPFLANQATVTPKARRWHLSHLWHTHRYVSTYWSHAMFGSGYVLETRFCGCGHHVPHRMVHRAAHMVVRPVLDE